ncbi:MAG TPA: response regulator, partial [Propionibacteriaceae bacterium]|nr:response regulator [Propionibacteriaceae bacterium]
MGSALPTIVIIDDSSEVRALIRARLSLSGRFAVVADAANGVDAIQLADRHKPALMLLDLSMPSMDGLDALPGILAVSPTTRVVIYTGFEELAIAESARELGASGFIEKSLPIERLVDELLAMIPGQSATAESDRRHRARFSIVKSTPDPDERQQRNDDDQEILDEHLETFREVFDEAAIGMATITLNGSVIRANQALANLLLCKPGDLAGQDYGRFTSGSGDVLDAAIREISSGSADLAEIEHDVAGWPQPRRARVSIAAVRDSSRRALYLFLQVQDITAQAAAEQRLHRSEERFRLLVEAVQEYAIIMLDTDGYVASWNAGAQRIKGYRASEIIGQHFRVFYPPAQQASRHPEFELAAAVRD